MIFGGSGRVSAAEAAEGSLAALKALISIDGVVFSVPCETETEEEEEEEEDCTTEPAATPPAAEDACPCAGGAPPRAASRLRYRGYFKWPGTLSEPPPGGLRDFFAARIVRKTGNIHNTNDGAVSTVKLF